jgi:hypothetical protein
MILVPGVKHRATDCLSRHSTNEAVQLVLPDDIASTVSPPQENGIQSAAVTTLSCMEIKSVTWAIVRTATASDKEMQELIELIELIKSMKCQQLIVRCLSR